DLRELASQWPGHEAELTGTAITSAVHGAQNAGPLARELLDQTLANPDVSQQAKKSLCLEFLRLGRHAADHVMHIARRALGQLADDSPSPLDTAGVVAIAGRAAWLYQLDAAIDLLLDAAPATREPRHLRRGDPVYEMESLVLGFHPEVPRQLGIRQQIARRASSWLTQAPTDPDRLRVAATVMQIVLSLGLRSTMAHPGRPHELHLFETIVPAEEARHISQEIWPQLEPLLDRQRPGLAAAAIDAAEKWLRIGAGYDHPFGQDHPQDRVLAAQKAGKRLARELAGRDDLSPGLLARLRSVVKRFDLEVAISLPSEFEVFFSEIQASPGNWL